VDIEYESILGRSEISLNFLNVLNNGLESHRVLVTGAGGSIGSQIAINLSTIPNLHLLATDRDENRLHSLSLKIQGSALFNDPLFNVLDVRDKQGVRNVFSSFNPTLVVHAAALKHLAILERQPREAYLTNVLGTQNVLEAAKEFGVSRFLNISTDKAARPTSTLGKTKHIAEILTASARDSGFEAYTSVRFGNVFNSKGSVIETFVNQILNGSPVTLTDKSVTRYFMKISEAANLSLLAALINAGDVHILEMGDPVLLLDVVDKLANFLGRDYFLVEVGLRPGEKLHEELFSENEAIYKTGFEKVNFLDLPKMKRAISDFQDNANSDETAIAIINSFLDSVDG
jgi:FlaA1/EpsC-like NDP-sugar epimerase